MVERPAFGGVSLKEEKLNKTAEAMSAFSMVKEGMGVAKSTR
jgi:hypothetical protein